VNCLDVRRLLAAEPASRDQALVQHLAACPSCAGEAARSARLERVLREAAAVPVPEGLDSRILLRQEFSDRPDRRRWLRPLALAASVACVAVAIAFARAPREAPIDAEVVALIAEAGYALDARGPVSEDEIAAALMPVGLGLDGPIGEVTFASRCLVRGRLAGHLVLRGESAPVTVFLIPHSLVEVRADVSSPTLAGFVMPDGLGTIAIVGAPGEQLAGIEEKVRAAVRWPHAGTA